MTVPGLIRLGVPPPKKTDSILLKPDMRSKVVASLTRHDSILE